MSEPSIIEMDERRFIDVTKPLQNGMAVSEKVTVSNAALEIYYEPARGSFWIQNNRGGWITINETALRRELKIFGLSPRAPEGSYVSPIDRELSQIQKTRDVAFAGSLAGYDAGLHDVCGQRILVTDSPKLIEPMAGDFPTIRALIDGLFCDANHDQKPFLFGWLKIAMESLHKKTPRAGQALVIAGERDCGKSLFQKLMTEMLGGRHARPYRYMSGGTDFNGDLFGSEHLVIEDDNPSTHIHARRAFGAQLKAMTVNDAQSCHAKHRAALSLSPFWRISVTLNDEPENLMVLPPIDESLADKMIVLRAVKTSMPMSTANGEQRKAFWKTLVSELPAFVDWLLKWEIPNDLKSERFGITHFHHPVILEAVNELAPENKLLELMDGECFKALPTPESWEGTAAELERLLTGEQSEVKQQARRLLTFNTACGVYLARLEKAQPERIKKQRTASNNYWKITAPVL